MQRRLLALLAAAVGVLTLSAASVAAPGNGNGDANKLQGIDHIVVIYEENHSFDNLYGGWEGTRGLSDADAAHTTQLGQTGPSSFAPYECLYQDDANLQAKTAANPNAPLDTTCQNTTGGSFPSHFANAPFSIDDYISPTDITCPPVLSAFSFPNGLRKQGINPFTNAPVPGARSGGCTRDIVHRFYEEQFQLNGGQQNRYALQSDAGGLVMGTYDTTKLPVYKYLHEAGHPKYAILDNFFQAAFGGSYLNHQWLIAAQTPTCSAANGCPAGATHSVLDRNGSPTLVSLPASSRPPGLAPLAVHLARHGAEQRRADAIVRPADDAHVARLWRLQRQHAAAHVPAFGARSAPSCRRRRTPTIGDRLTAKGVDWAWYSGGWSNANGNVGIPAGRTAPAPPDADRLLRPERRPRRLALAGVPGQPVPVPPPAVQLLRQLLDADGRRAREPRCASARRAGVHPGRERLDEPLRPEAGQLHQADRRGERASGLRERAGRQRPPRRPAAGDRERQVQGEHARARHLRRVRRPVGSRAAAGPGQQQRPARPMGPGDAHPGARARPAPKGPFVVDHTEYDTTAVLATIEQRYGLAPLSSRDAAMNSLANVFAAH